MVVDYSKWDKLELSDDSDIEVHPNVDKRSFIRWKQQDIHAKRAQRNHEIATLETQTEMYKIVNERVDQLLKDCNDEQLGDYNYVVEYLKTHFDVNSKPTGESIEPNPPTHNEMIEDLFTQLKKDLEKAGKDPNSGAELRLLVTQHRAKIDNILTDQLDKLRSLKKERELQISSDNIHTGFDSSFINKSKDKPLAEVPVPVESTSTSAPVPTSTTKTAPTASTTAPPAAAAAAPATSATPAPATKATDKQSEEVDLNLNPKTIEFLNINSKELIKLRDFLKDNISIITPQQKDALLMTAFESQFENNTFKTKEIISHSLIIQYIIDLVQVKKPKHEMEYKILIDSLFDKIFLNETNKTGLQAFLTEHESTFNHIKQRCEILSKENEMDEDAQEIQLKSLDDNSKLIVNLPDENSQDPEEVERFKIFSKIPEKMRIALKTESLDQVNQVFHGMPIKQAEEILELFDQCGVIGVEAIVENEDEWNQLKGEFDNQQPEESVKSPNDIEVPEIIDSADIVD